MRSIDKYTLVISLLLWTIVHAWVPFIDGGKEIPRLYQGYFDGQIAKQAATAVSNAVAAGRTQIEVQFPPVPNLDEVRFGTPLNQRFGRTVVGPDLRVPGGYVPGADLARQQVAFANVYWAKKIAAAVGGFGTSVQVYSAEPVTYAQIREKGRISQLAPLSLRQLAAEDRRPGAAILINPGGEETWERLRAAASLSDRQPCVILNNAYSTTYGLGNQQGYEEAYVLKRISKGWIFRTFPGPWRAYLEKPDGTVELLQSFTSKPALNAVATLVREESFRRYAINNDRWTPGFGERL
jgi:Domain of unknown function (DUF1995)